jgi:hypothetical protein
MKYQKSLFILSFCAISILSLSSDIAAQPPRQNCSNITQVTPSAESREIYNQEFEFKFKIPANYRTQKRGDGNELSIDLRNPADVELLECCRINREIGCGHQVSDVIVTVKPRPANIQNISDIPPSPSRGIKVFNIIETMISNQAAIIYTVQSLYPMTTKYVAFFTPDRQYLVTIYTGDYGEEIDPIDEMVFNQVVDSFEFIR